MGRRATRATAPANAGALRCTHPRSRPAAWDAPAHRKRREIDSRQSRGSTARSVRVVVARVKLPLELHRRPRARLAAGRLLTAHPSAHRSDLTPVFLPAWLIPPLSVWPESQGTRGTERLLSRLPLN